MYVRLFVMVVVMAGTQAITLHTSDTIHMEHARLGKEFEGAEECRTVHTIHHLLGVGKGKHLG